MPIQRAKVAAATGACILLLSLAGRIFWPADRQVVKQQPPAVDEAQHDSRFELVGRQETFVFAWIDPANVDDREAYRAAIATGGDADVLTIGFWSSRSRMPRSLPMSSDAEQAQVADYHRNRHTGVDRLQLLDNGKVSEEFSPP
jgi:hypothetical protein